MWNFKSKIKYILYQVTAAWLPESRHCKLAKSLRGFWARRIIQSCGKCINIERNAKFTPSLSVGDHSGIGINCELYGKITIGSYVLMGPEVVIYTRNHQIERTDIPIGLQGMQQERPVIIGNDIWIGRRAIILPGVIIGDGCVIGAGAVVTKDVPAYSVVGGVPARIIRRRSQNEDLRI